MPAFDHFAVIAPLYARVPYSKTDVMREAASLPVRGRFGGLMLRQAQHKLLSQYMKVG